MVNLLIKVNKIFQLSLSEFLIKNIAGMNTTDSDKNNYFFDNVKKIEVEQKCFDKTFKAENKFSLKKNKGKKVLIYLNILWYQINE